MGEAGAWRGSESAIVMRRNQSEAKADESVLVSDDLIHYAWQTILLSKL